MNNIEDENVEDPHYEAGGQGRGKDQGNAHEREEDTQSEDISRVLTQTSSISAQVAEYLAKNPEVIKDWLDEEPTVLEKVLEKVKNTSKLKQNGKEDVQRSKKGPIGKTKPKKEEKTQGKPNDLVPSKKVSRKDQKRKSFSDSAQFAGLSPDAIYNEAQKSNKLMDLILDISNELDINVLSHKILVNVATLTDADRCSLFLVRGPKDERYLEAKLFDVTVDTSLDEAMEKASSSQLLLQYGCGVAGTVALTGQTINIADVYQDPRFNSSVDQKTGFTTHSIACLPIFNHQGEVAGVAQIVNKKSGPQFTKNDIEIFEKYLTFCGVGIQNAQLFEASVLEYKKNQLLLSLAKSLFQEQTSLDRLITTIIREAKDMLKCERCTVFLLDLKMYDQVEQETWIAKDSVPLLSSSTNILASNAPNSQPVHGGNRFIPGEFTDDNSSQTSFKDLKEEYLSFQVAYEMNHVDNETIKYPCNRIENAKRLKIAKHVATNSEVLNLENVSNWFEEDVIEEDGFKPKSMLTIPIYNGQSTVIGVAQLINKLNGQHFDANDISITEAFAIFCGIGIHNTKTYESACKLMAKQRVALDCLSYHATANDNDTVWLAREAVPAAEEFNLYSYKFNDTKFGDSTTLKIVLRIFLDFDLMNKFSIPHEVVCRWALSVKKNYRPVKYHNWRHALNVCQTMFTVLKTGKMDRFMEDMEVFGLLVACLCHDLDHRGTNNSYQTKVDSPLAVLYSTATMEHHHFDQCVMILSSEGNNIFQGLSTEEYRYVMKVVEQAILSTDLASYFEKRERFVSTADDGEIDWQGADKKKLLCGMLMTAADVSAIAKPWELQHETAKMVADEFFDQGDMEKLQLNITPMGMMDREKKDELPQMQVEFIDRICVPLYRVLSDSFPWIEPLLDGALSNRARWADLRDKVEMGLTWIDHDIIEVPVEEVEVGTSEAEDLKLTVETLKCKEEGKLEVETTLVKKRSFRSMRSPVRPPVGFFNRRLSTRHKGATNSRTSLTSSLSTELPEQDKLEIRREVDHPAQSPDDTGPPSIVISHDTFHTT